MLQLKLQDYELEILGFTSKFLYVQDCHLASLYNYDLLKTNKIIKRLVNGGYLTTNKILANQPNYISLTADSAKYLGLKFKPHIALNTLAHDTLLVWLFLYLAITINAGDILTDLELKRESAFDQKFNKRKLPDLLINNNIAIELELSQKSHIRLQEIINGYIVNDNINLVEYYVLNKALAHKIWQLTNNHPKFKFYLINQSEQQQIVDTTLIDMALESTSEFIAKPSVVSFGGYVFE